MKLFSPLSPFLSFLLLAGLACDSQKTTLEAGDLAFTNVNVLPMTENTVLPDQTVIVRDGKIWKMGPVAELPLKGEGTVIDAKGQYLLPGISEMHAHIPTPREGDDENVRETLFLYLSNGITTIRGMLGQPYHLELKEQIAAGDILSPRVYTSSPSCNGNTVQTVEEAQTKVAQYAADGYDFLKIHPGIKLDVFTELVNTARKEGIAFSGHVPVDVGVDRAIDFQYASIDHLDGYIDGLVPKTDDFDPNAGGLFGYNFTDAADPAVIPDLVRRTKEAGIWIVPTQSLLARWVSPKTGAEMTTEPEMKYVAPGTRFSWRQSKDQIIGQEDYTPGTAEKFIGLRRQLLKEMEKQGVDLLLGSDAPQIFNVPGFSIQHEMQAMADAGLSNYAILRSGTANPARFFGQEGEYGVVQEGSSADLILLSANPLEDIRNMQNPQGVMVRGQWMDRAFLDEKLAEIEAKYENE
jgi:imidazolonepropionase-like amidohydrolase